jgi:uncharacterized protein YceH (UPF0502 family)
MLRGPQTAGELRQRSERIHGFESGEEVERALDELVERELAVALPRRPGERGQRYAHRLAEVEEDTGAAPAEAAAPLEPSPVEPLPAPSPAADGLAERLERLEGEVAALRDQLHALRDELGA